MGSRDCVASITSYRLDSWGFKSQYRHETSPCSKMSRIALEPRQHPVQWVSRVLSWDEAAGAHS